MTLILAATFFVSVSAMPALAAGPADLISQFRASNGQGKVVMDATLNAIAQRQAAAMASKDVLSHEAGGSFTSRVAPAKASRAAENIAYGYPDFPNTLKQWINSPGHRANLLLKGASKIGVASVRSSASGRTYWAMVIAGGDERPKPGPKSAPKSKSKSKQPGKPSAKLAATSKTAAQPPATWSRVLPKPPAARDCTVRLLGLCM
nr:CAP domain-containing protein [Rhodopseudomonas palustris]